jgi:hypothetical protein
MTKLTYNALVSLMILLFWESTLLLPRDQPPILIGDSCMAIEYNRY